MAVECYDKLKAMVKEEADSLPYIWSVGAISGGTAHNVICDKCSMDISFRFYDNDFAKRVEKRLEDICNEVSKKFGGRIETVFDMSTGAVHNDPTLCDKFESKIKNAGVRVVPVKREMCSEDFGWYITKSKGLLFRFGTRNEQTGCTLPYHTCNFMIDENGMRTALLSFISYVF